MFIQEKNKSSRMKKILYIISWALVLIGLMFVFYQWNKEHSIVKQNDKGMKQFFQSTIIYDNDGNVINEAQSIYNYVLEIPVISLKRGVVITDNVDNEINYNIAVSRNSDTPDRKNSNVVLYAHSGTGSVTFFHKINKLKRGDQIYLYAKNKKYIYQVYNSDIISQYGSIENNIEKSVITLITCNEQNDTERVIVRGKLEEVESR